MLARSLVGGEPLKPFRHRVPKLLHIPEALSVLDLALQVVGTLWNYPNAAKSTPIFLRTCTDPPYK